MHKAMTGKVFIITGSTEGIGKEVASLVLRAGGKVIVNGRSEAKRIQVERDFAAYEKNFIYVPCDISNSNECKELVDSAIISFGRLDYLILNAGMSSSGTIDILSPEVARQIISTNLLGAFYILGHAAKHLKANKGALLFVSSLAGIYGLPSQAPYCASKMALMCLYQSLRIELRGTGVFAAIALLSFTENDQHKTRLNAQGLPERMPSRNHIKPANKSDVAGQMLQQLIQRRKPVRVYSKLGVLGWWVSKLAPGVYERVITNQWRKHIF
jgi:NAD(P)-dependent dehydrogenase (short-subunit alcohol dehydrogenase family)